MATISHREMMAYELGVQRAKLNKSQNPFGCDGMCCLMTDRIGYSNEIVIAWSNGWGDEMAAHPKRGYNTNGSVPWSF